MQTQRLVCLTECFVSVIVATTYTQSHDTKIVTICTIEDIKEITAMFFCH